MFSSKWAYYYQKNLEIYPSNHPISLDSCYWGEPPLLVRTAIPESSRRRQSRFWDPMASSQKRHGLLIVKKSSHTRRGFFSIYKSSTWGLPCEAARGGGRAFGRSGIPPAWR